MNARDALARHFGLMYQTAQANLDGITAERSVVQPEPGGNCPNWILGHLVRVQNAVMDALGEDPVWANPDLERAAADPITGPDDAIDWDELTGRFLASREPCLEAIGRLSDDALAETVPDPFGGTCSRAELLHLLAFHQTYHVGQLGLARRLVGLPGAVRAPDQPEGTAV